MNKQIDWPYKNPTEISRTTDKVHLTDQFTEQEKKILLDSITSCYVDGDLYSPVGEKLNTDQCKANLERAKSIRVVKRCSLCGNDQYGLAYSLAGKCQHCSAAYIGLEGEKWRMDLERTYIPFRPRLNPNEVFTVLEAGPVRIHLTYTYLHRMGMGSGWGIHPGDSQMEKISHGIMKKAHNDLLNMIGQLGDLQAYHGQHGMAESIQIEVVDTQKLETQSKYLTK